MKKSKGITGWLKSQSWIKGALISVIVLPILIFSWHNIQSIWAAPEKLDSVDKKLTKQETALEQIAKLSVEQQGRIEKDEAVRVAEINALNKQLELIAELKKK